MTTGFPDVLLSQAGMARFWRKVNKDAGSDGCWLWTGAKAKKGYGYAVASVGGRQMHYGAHRLAFVLANGPIPAGLNVCHRCDVPLCVNPAHLFLGTNADNMRDSAQKGRKHVPRTGALTLADRLTIYHTPSRQRLQVELSQRYGVSTRCIRFYLLGRFIGSPVSPRGQFLQSAKASTERTV